MNIALILSKKLPTATYVLYGDTYEYSEVEGVYQRGLLWLDETIEKPTLAQLNEWDIELSTEVNRDWNGLEKDITDSELFARVYKASKSTLKANSAFTLLTSTITTTHNHNNLLLALEDLRSSMAGSASIGDFTSEEIASIKNLLSKNGFDPSIIN